MALCFNHVLAIRDAGSLMPTTYLNETIVSDCTINTLKVDSSFKETNKDSLGNISISEIVPNPDNLPLIPVRNDWSLDTDLYAMFNGDLEAGPLSFLGNEVDSVIVRRTSNRKAFTQWEDVVLIEDVQDVVDKDFNFKFNDKCVESGILYRYGLQPISNGKRGSLYRGANTHVVYEDIFLVGEDGKQLKIRFNPAVTSVKTNIRESRVETLGSQYPYITRNGNVRYKEFPLSGTITHFMDTTEEFAPRGDLFVEDEFAAIEGYHNNSMLYEAMYRENDLNAYNNNILEREFRDKVVNFLQDGKPKLFKSPTEGCMIVRIMDVSLTPNQQLGRLIYDFSCNVVEIDDYNLNTCEKYKIQER